MIDRRILLAGAASALPTLALAQTGGTTVSPLDVTTHKPAAPDPTAPKPVPYSLDELYRPPLTLDVGLAPDGKSAAALVRAAPDGKPITGIRVATTDAGGAMVHQARFGEVDARWLTWSSSQRLLVGVSEARNLTITRRFSRIAQAAVKLDYRRILSVALDGSPSAVLMTRLAQDIMHSLDFELVAAQGGDGEHALLSAYKSFEALKEMNGGLVANITGVPGELTLYRANLKTGEQVALEKGEYGSLWWLAQNGKAVLRCDTNEKGTVETLFARASTGKTWRKVRSGPAGDPDFRCLVASADLDKVWVIAKAPGEAHGAVRQYDVATGALGPAQLPHGDPAPAGALIDPNGALVAVEYTRAGKADYVFTDAALGAHLDGLRAFFDYDAAVRMIGADPAGQRFLILVSGPQDPGGWYAYDRNEKRIEPIAGRQPWLQPERLSRGDLVQVKQGDTVTDGCLTGPLDGAPGPLLVQIQSAVEVRDLFDYDREAQGLAAKGWWQLRCVDPTPEALDALVAHAQGVAAIAGRPVVVMGGVTTSETAFAHARRKPGLYRAAISMTPHDTVPILNGFSYAGIDKVATAGAITAADGAKLPALLVYPYGDRIAAFNRSSREMAEVLDQEGIGGLSAVRRLRSEGDRSWGEQASQQGRMQAVLDFLGKAVKD